jgi:hypothetical protein
LLREFACQISNAEPEIDLPGGRSAKRQEQKKGGADKRRQANPF